MGISHHCNRNILCKLHAVVKDLEYIAIIIILTIFDLEEQLNFPTTAFRA